MSNEKTRVTTAAVTVLSNGEIVNNTFLIKGPRVDKRLYRELDSVLTALGGKWSSEAKGHVFPTDPGTLIKQVVDTFGYDRPRDHGYFPTPDNVAMKLVGAAHIERGMKVLEPSAGKGAIAEHVAMYVGFGGVTLIELLEQHVRVLRQTFPEVIQGDFLKMIPNPISQFDRIVMNPPFHRHIAHVRHAWRFLKPGGRLVSIMAASVETSQNLISQRFRDFASKHGTIARNPYGSFAESGTMVETVTVILDKP